MRTAEHEEATAAVAALREARAGLDEQLREVAVRRGAAEAELQARTARRGGARPPRLAAARAR